MFQKKRREKGVTDCSDHRPASELKASSALKQKKLNPGGTV